MRFLPDKNIQRLTPTLFSGKKLYGPNTLFMAKMFVLLE
jgi:hypothetical protein